MQNDGAPGTTDSAQPELRRGSPLRAYALLAAAFLVVALVGALVLTGARSVLAVQPKSPQERAWIFNPLRTNAGVRPGAPLQFVVVHPSSGSVSWTVRGAGVLLASGTAPGAPGQTTTTPVSTSKARPNTWLTISISGLGTPLKIWVK